MKTVSHVKIFFLKQLKICKNESLLKVQCCMVQRRLQKFRKLEQYLIDHVKDLNRKFAEFKNRDITTRCFQARLFSVPFSAQPGWSELQTIHSMDSLQVVHLFLQPCPWHVKNGEAPGTHCLRMRLISPRCGQSGLFSDSSVLCDIRVRTRYSMLVRIIQQRVIKLRIFSK